MRLRAGRPGRMTPTAILTLADQALISASNFITMLLIARALDPDAFGLFNLAYITLFLANALQGALITTPLAVLASPLSGSRYRQYTSSTGLSQLVFAVVLVVPLAAGTLVTGSFEAAGGSQFTLWFVVAGFAWQLQEFARRVLYVENRIAAALVTDIVSYGGQVLVVSAFAVTGKQDAVSASAANGVTPLVSAVGGGLAIRHSVAARPTVDPIRENLRYGSWLAGGELVNFMSIRLYTYMVAALRGPAAAGVLGASTIIMGPLNVVLLSANTYLPITLARARATGGDPTVRHRLARFHLLTTPVVAAYAGVVALFAEPILAVAYGPKYQGYGPVLALLAVFHLLRYDSTLVAIGLRVLHRTRAVFTGYATSAVVSISGGWLLIINFGVIGAAMGMIVSVTTFSLIWWRAYLRDRGRGAPLSLTDPALGADL
jgi:O-antigen/teichoic acid export membrane protein